MRVVENNIARAGLEVEALAVLQGLSERMPRRCRYLAVHLRLV